MKCKDSRRIIDLDDCFLPGPTHCLLTVFYPVLRNARSWILSFTSSFSAHWIHYKQEAWGHIRTVNVSPSLSRSAHRRLFSSVSIFPTQP